MEAESPKVNMENYQNKEVKEQKSQSAKKKKKKHLNMNDATSVDIEGVGDGKVPDVNLQGEDDVKSPTKGKKRKNQDANMPKNKKKPVITDDDMVKPPTMKGEQNGDDLSAEETLDAQPMSKNIGNLPVKNKNKKPQKQKWQQKLPAAASGPPLLAEGPLMTQFEGYWVRRRAVPRLERIRAELAASISDPQTLKREMKKRKRAEHRLLLSQLAARGARKPTSAAARLQDDAAENDDEDGGDHADVAQGSDAEEDKDDASDGEADTPGEERSPPAKRRTVADVRNPGGGAPREERMVKFDGVWMTADAVGRLKELRRQLKLQRVSEMVLKQTMKTARRREEMKRKRDAKRVCLGCRQPGHLIGDCPNRAPGLKAPTGHLSRDCALNPNGVYPKGGSCKVCQRRDHLADDCPERREEEAAATAPRLATIGDGPLEEDYQHDFRETQTTAVSAAPATRTPRKVKF
ncbi:Zinc finger CCHC domain-containing protein 9 [Amphibalanus amphitrite]|uniref:Zinc finger CCHC domain-containing protein 9 n=1 Tax=Amphibalanus amphitrite TaxID=1232801 RepID=A0A6A4W5I0_AMPAM|nr:Zinc finger CCHC domain-containing protein 9 [Amphibalanus amphitrite]KAF0301193.1 Zinc finger CCHC domain-containing protein 9 [Amphibalanus amphitrite]